VSYSGTHSAWQRIATHRNRGNTLQSITGTWQLIQTECIGDDGASLAPPYGGGESCMGLLSLRADGRLVCVLCDSRPQMPAGQAREYNSYCGAYEFDGEQLVTRVDASANPDWIGTDQIRDVSFDNEVLILRPVKNNGPVSNGQRVLHWIRLPDAVS
jgi:hypothetical protein